MEERRRWILFLEKPLLLVQQLPLFPPFLGLVTLSFHILYKDKVRPHVTAFACRWTRRHGYLSLSWHECWKNTVRVLGQWFSWGASLLTYLLLTSSPFPSWSWRELRYGWLLLSQSLTFFLTASIDWGHSRSYFLQTSFSKLLPSFHGRNHRYSSLQWFPSPSLVLEIS